jgi:hypothetical protein
MIFRKTLVIASVSAMLGMTAIVPTAAVAQFGPPPGPPPGIGGPPPGLAGPPPGLGGQPPGLAGPPSGLGGHPPGLGGPAGGPPQAGIGGPRLGTGGGAPRFSRLDGVAGGRGLESRAAAVASRSSAYGYARYGSSGYGHGYGRGYRPYGAYEYGSSYASSDDSGCYYTSTYRRGAYRRVLICTGD